LALDAEISTRHLSFIETGRAQPSRRMLLRLAEQLDIPLRQRNILFVAAGFAPIYPEQSLDDAELTAVRRALDLILAGHEPCPALAVDFEWNLVAANAAVAPLLEGVVADLLTPPMNVMRLALHPDGLAPRIANLAEWRAYLLERLHRQLRVTADARLASLIEELEGYPTPPATDRPTASYGRLATTLQLMAKDQLLTFITTTTVFGTPSEVTMSELTLETFFPADELTATAIRHS
jgi:transcriptional regulator with XRE-family HTH domain